MTKTRRVRLSPLYASLLVLGLSILFWPSTEPRFQGRTVRQWVRRGFYDDIYFHRTPIDTALKAIGPSHAVPILIDELSARPIAARAGYAHFFNRMPAGIRKKLPRPFSTADYRFWIWMLLENYEPADLKPSLPSLIQAVQNPDVLTRSFAKEILGRLGPDAAEALPILWKQLREARAVHPRSFPVNTAEAIQKIDPNSAELVNVLAEWLADDRMVSHERVRAIKILGRIGPDAKTAVPVLIKATDSQDESLSSEAGDALVRIRYEPRASK
jgi:hypothetical protein